MHKYLTDDSSRENKKTNKTDHTHTQQAQNTNKANQSKSEGEVERKEDRMSSRVGVEREGKWRRESLGNIATAEKINSR